MSTIHSLLAAIDLELNDVVDSWKKMHETTRDAFIIFGTLAWVTLLVLLWAALIRRRRRRRHANHHRHHHSKPLDQAPPAETGSDPTPHTASAGLLPKRRKWRRRRREHRPRNPTLAETGGLPPARNEREGDH